MKYFKANELGRTLIIRLEPGDYLREKIMELCEEENIKNAVVLSGIATFDEANLQMATTLGYPIKYHIEHLKEPLELAALDGTMIHSDLHVHGVISNAKTTWSGHLLDGCRILYLAEIVLQEIRHDKLIRKRNSNGVFVISEESGER